MGWARGTEQEQGTDGSRRPTGRRRRDLLLLPLLLLLVLLLLLLLLLLVLLVVLLMVLLLVLMHTYIHFWLFYIPGFSTACRLWIPSPIHPNS